MRFHQRRRCLDVVWKRRWRHYAPYVRLSRETVNDGVTRIRVAVSLPFSDTVHVFARPVAQCRHEAVEEYSGGAYPCSYAAGHTGAHRNVFFDITWDADAEPEKADTRSEGRA